MIKKTISYLAFAAMLAFNSGCFREIKRPEKCAFMQPALSQWNIRSVSCEEVSQDELLDDNQSYNLDFINQNNYSACGGEEGVYCCCKKIESGHDGGLLDGGILSDGGSEDGGLEQVVYSEQEGVEIIYQELIRLGYQAEKNDGSWEIVLQDPNTHEYSVFLRPDLRFKDASSQDYSYFEFNSQEDPGIGFSSQTPFYEEIQPNLGSNIRRTVQELLKEP